MTFLAILLKTTDGTRTKMLLITLWRIVSDLAQVAESAKIWKYVISHIDLVNMRKNSLFLTLTGL